MGIRLDDPPHPKRPQLLLTGFKGNVGARDNGAGGAEWGTNRHGGDGAILLTD